ncbi:hypothetical protein B9Z65_5959 [Elsinoe australis]|uniref:DUF676 domain-containing protein n=1 Tax=Elsinoe australis TaxID=40998 RepID=A0A2P7YJK3_9PEZI|nr:hypothetical protein B9Z65_5959 [Elsinoe australis]
MFPKRSKDKRVSPGNVPNGLTEVKRKPTQRLGLRQCTEPDDDTKAVDVVFVHGLTGNRDKTWTHASTSCFWPEELLPTDLPNARVYTYGYDADVIHVLEQASQSRIANHAQTLLSTLANARERSETADRPLFFVAHSLGGLVVEDMLLHAKNSAEDHMKSVLSATAGICFMGTPHCGSHLADWAKVCRSVASMAGANTDIVGVLQPQSEVLARIQQEFHTMIRARGDAGQPQLRITCFYEDLDTRGVGAVVPKHSAILPAYTAISIHGDHTGMTKFSDATDTGYQRVSNELWRWVRDVNRLRSAKRVDMPSISPVPAPKASPLMIESAAPPPANYFYGTNNNIGGNLFQGNNSGTFNQGGGQSRYSYHMS